jgi:hypothetical protein
MRPDLTATLPAPTPAPTAAGVRYAQSIAQLHRGLRWHGLLDAIDGAPVTRLDGLGDGLTTIAVTTNQLPERYQRALFGFRLAEFLQTGLMDVDLARSRGLAHEALPNEHGLQSVHIATLTDDGALVGYACLARSPDAEPLPLDHPDRRPFPVEAAHDVNVVTPYAQPHWTTHQVFEIKRLIRRGGMPRDLQRARVPWHLIVALGQVGLAMGERVEVIVGDSGERGALRHLGAMGFQLDVIEGTRPSLPRDQLMWPSYELDDAVRAKPFAARVDRAALAAHTSVVESALRDYHGADWQQHATERLVALIAQRAMTTTGAQAAA